MEKTYTIAQVVGEPPEEVNEYFSPNIPIIQGIKDEAVEGMVAAARDRLRKVDFDRLGKEAEQYRLAQQEKARQDKAAADKLAAEKAAKQAQIDAHKAKVAEGKRIDEGKEEVRWSLLDVDMFDRSLFKPLEGKFSFDFLTAESRIKPWYKFELEAQKKWGQAMVQIIKSARYTFGVLSNSGTDHRGWVFYYEKRRKGTLNSISKMKFKIRGC